MIFFMEFARKVVERAIWSFSAINGAYFALKFGEIGKQRDVENSWNRRTQCCNVMCKRYIKSCEHKEIIIFSSHRPEFSIVSLYHEKVNQCF